MVEDHDWALKEAEEDKLKVEEWAKKELNRLKQFHEEEKLILHQKL